MEKNHYCSIGKHYVSLDDVPNSSKANAGNACRTCARERKRQDYKNKLNEKQRLKDNNFFDVSDKKLFI